MKHFGSLSLAKCFYVPKAYAKKETSPLSRFARNSLPHKKASRFFVPQCSSGSIYCHSLVSRNCITIYGAKPIYAPENLDSFASLTLRSLRSLSKFFTRLGAYARKANPIPRSSRYSFAALALTSPALPDSPAPRLQPYIGIRFLLFVACKRTLVP